MSNFVIRACEKNDIAQIVRLQKEWQLENITYGFSAADFSYLEEKLGNYFYVAENNDVIVGFAYGNIEKAQNMNIFDDGEYYIEIEDIYTTSHFRSLGVGSLLLKKLLNTAKEHGILRSLLFSSTKDIKKTMHFYESHGFKSWNIQMYK
jgi:GNAT superfamily N-acetyltransferase